MPADHPVRQDGLTRPRVIVSVTATADGRVTLNRAERLLDNGPDLRWKTAWPPDVADLLTRREAAIEQRHHPTVFLEGSGTFVADAAGALPLKETSLLVVASHGTPLPYLAYLRRERIPYLLAGTLHVDLASALAKFQLQLGAQCVVSTAGGGLNGALLRAGLVDELHIITVPALTGGLGTPSIIDGPPLEPAPAASRTTRPPAKPAGGRATTG